METVDEKQFASPEHEVSLLVSPKVELATIPEEMSPVTTAAKFSLLNYQSDFNWFPEDFVFELNLSFPQRRGAIGLDLCEALLNFNRKYGFDNFEVKTRISDEEANPKRWDLDFMEEYLTAHHITVR